MAEDIRDMFVTGSVSDFRKHTGADIYLLRNGKELSDDEELCAVGGLDMAFSIRYAEPVLGIRTISANKLTREMIEEDKTIRFLQVPDSLKWDHFEAPRFFFPGPRWFGAVTALPFFETVNLHWKGREIGYIYQSYDLHPYEVFRNSSDGITIDKLPEGVLIVMRHMEDGRKRVMCPALEKNFIL